MRKLKETVKEAQNTLFFTYDDKKDIYVICKLNKNDYRQVKILAHYNNEINFELKYLNDPVYSEGISQESLTAVQKVAKLLTNKVVISGNTMISDLSLWCSNLWECSDVGFDHSLSPYRQLHNEEFNKSRERNIYVNKAYMEFIYVLHNEKKPIISTSYYMYDDSYKKRDSYDIVYGNAFFLHHELVKLNRDYLDKERYLIRESLRDSSGFSLLNRFTIFE